MSAVHRSSRWSAIRLAAKRRDNFACVRCGRRGKLEVDHIIPARREPARAFDLDAVQTLCVTCHVEKTRREVGKGEPDPQREEWKALVRDLSTPSTRKEQACSNQ